MTATLRKWLPFAIVTTVVVFLVYVSVQQVYRTSANDPQIQYAEEMARQLRKTQSPEALGASPLLSRPVPTLGPVELSEDTVPFLMALDNDGDPITGKVVLDGRAVAPPKGVLEAARAGKGMQGSPKGENRVTWQPRPGVRIALVVVDAGGKAYAVSGRSLRDTEDRTRRLGVFSLAAWLAALAGTFAALALFSARTPAA